ncbi:uncharacterized protein LOC143226305 isoform X2 [Tachypleus tridentatus]|uniref:uncharacterized protein LOC143226305 isoform X2 n=1 Tax=Tachypleus tridentatus TaxID=6853 RepID=UPI003FD1DBE4
MKTIIFSLWIIVVLVSTFAQNLQSANLTLLKPIPIRPIYYYCDECFLERTQEGRAIRRCWCSFLRYYRRYLFSSTETMKYRYLSRLCQCIRNAIRRYPPGVATIRPPIKLSLANMTRTG